MDRYTTSFLANRVGADFEASVSGVTRFGLFVTLRDTGADGLVPISSLPDDYYRHDEAMHRLVGDHTGRTYRLGDIFSVRLVEATPVTGGMLFEILDHPKGTVRQRGKPHRGKHHQRRR